jgi:predicted DNA-binding transcriptional regulator YafY
MNKLHVALKLIHLLNERKSLNSRIVADELNVSLRTAQRYLNDLSVLPCVISSEKAQTNIFSLSNDYELKDALINAHGSEHVLRELTNSNKRAFESRDAICSVCGNCRGKLVEMPFIHGKDNRQKINSLISIIRKQLLRGKCSFP